MALHIEQMTKEMKKAKERKRKIDHLRFNTRIKTHTHARINTLNF